MEASAPWQTVLCIDDTPDVRMLVRRLLSHRYRVLEAIDGLRGIELATLEHPDLVLVDLHMPHLTGYEVATRIKSLLPRVPVVALTADVTAHVRERALASGCDGYISKPIDPDGFEEHVASYIGGKRELLKDDRFRESYQETLVQRLEEKVRELTQAVRRNEELNRQNVQLLQKARRQAQLLEVGARVGRSITSILDLDALLNATVDIICDEFALYYAGVFMIDESGQWAVLRAGRGAAGAAMIAQGHRLRVGGNSMVGDATAQRRAVISLDTEGEEVHFANPHLPETRSEMALPLLVGDDVIGALTVQSAEENAFGDDDIKVLQSMADQLAIAINNARLL